MTNKRIIILILVVLTVVLAAGGVVISNKLQQSNLTPTQSEAASQEVWDAELVRNQTQRDQFANGWKQLQNSAGYNFAMAKQYLDGAGARFKIDTAILKVGNETLYGRDLNYYLFFFHFDTYTSSKALTDADVDPGLNILISDSLIIQKAVEISDLRTDSTFFNSTVKDFTKRNQVVEQYKPIVAKQFVETVEGEAIFIWFNNSVVPVSQGVGKQVAQQKMNDLYTRLTKGEITMQQAADIISTDKDILTKADPNAAANAYYKFTSEKGGPVTFENPDLEAQLYSLGEGQFSKVLTGKLHLSADDISKAKQLGTDLSNMDGTELFFVIIKVNKRSAGTKYQTTDQFVQNEPQSSIQSGTSQVYIKRGN